MPLRSVEAASRDDAIAAAREQFGPQARVVGVRRVRSGGVLGFFATERYVAEVAELAPPTAVPSRSGADDDLPADFSSPLASAAPARAAAPARNGAAAWAAEAASRSVDDIPEEVRAAAAAARAARSAGRVTAPAPSTRTPAWSAAPSRPADDERVGELVGLLTTQQAEPAAPTSPRTPFPRVSFPRTATVSRPGGSHEDDEATATPVRGSGDAVRSAGSAAPSPFTAALARMVAGDQDVRQAVQEALAQPVASEQPAGPVQPVGTARPAETVDAEPWPARSEPTRTVKTSAPPFRADQEEETVGDQVEAPPSMTKEVEVPTWAAAPEVPTSSSSEREEAIADLLRGALAQGHSDEALAGILRKVLAGASPQTALAEPVFAVPTLPVPSLDLPPVDQAPLGLPVGEVSAPDRQAADRPAGRVVEPRAVAANDSAPVVPAPAVPAPAAPAPAVAEPPAEAPVAAVTPAAEVVESLPVVLPSATASMWGPPAPTSLWGDAPVASASTPVAPIWATVTQESVDAPLFPASVAVEPAADVVLETPEAETPAAEVPVETRVVEASASHAVEASTAELAEDAEVAEVAEDTEDTEDTEVDELAPVLARTASDPAPTMSLDATTVMPPLSLLPPLPSSRGRGRPPVPPATSRAAGVRPSARASAGPATEPAAPTVAATSPGASAETTAPAAGRSLATVTRLPVAPLTVGREMPEDVDQPGAQELFDAPEPDSMFAPAVPVAAPAPAAVPLGSVSDRLVQLGLPVELLGSSFQSDVAQLGTYAALTRSLALQLPRAPELPRGAGEAVFVVGPGADALRAARSLAASLHLDPDCVQWATRGDLAGLAPRSSRIPSVDAAIDRRQESIADGTVAIVAVDAPLRTDAFWMEQLVGVWAPVAVWAVVEATRKPEDLQPWLSGLPRVDALIVQDADLSADPAAVLRRVDAPVAVVDGMWATPHRWASLLCERLDHTAR